MTRDIRSFLGYVVAVVVIALGFLIIDEQEHERDEYEAVMAILAGA